MQSAYKLSSDLNFTGEFSISSQKEEQHRNQAFRNDGSNERGEWDKNQAQLKQSPPFR